MATNKEARSSSIEEDQTWVLDSLVGFLGSPLWSSSLNDFTDQKSIVFDPDDIETEEGEVKHRIEYEIIFKQYRSLVDRLIGSHMNDLGIDENQFARACEMADDVLADKLKKILFEEFWAAENYEVFVRLMAKRNVELQLEALEMLARKYGMIYDVFVPIGSSAKNFLSEEHAVREAILRSLNDLELQEQVEQNRTIKQKLLPSEEKFENNRNNQQEQSVLIEEQQKQKQTDKEI
ncbi:The ARF-like protein 2 binding protein BART-like protein, partial [Sarcoptes scabiei]